MPKKFQKKKEDFRCEQCGQEVSGTGFTNHCPKCLWSKHVDTYPGDRAADCGGMMPPVALAYEGGVYSIIHRCMVCGHTKRNATSPDDSMDALITLSKKQHA